MLGSSSSTVKERRIIFGSLRRGGGGGGRLSRGLSELADGERSGSGFDADRGTFARVTQDASNGEASVLVGFQAATAQLGCPGQVPNLPALRFQTCGVPFSLAFQVWILLTGVMFSCLSARSLRQG